MKSNHLLVSWCRTKSLPHVQLRLYVCLSCEVSGGALATSRGCAPDPLLVFLSRELQLEYTARLDFLWRVQAKEEINEMQELREHNENMLRNILPSHVARHFLEKDRDNEVSPGPCGPRGRGAGRGRGAVARKDSPRPPGSGRIPPASREHVSVETRPITWFWAAQTAQRCERHRWPPRPLGPRL